MTALGAALALVEVDAVAVHVGKDLDLDVVRLVEVLLEVDGVVAEARHGFALRGAPGGVEVGHLFHAPHALAAAAAGGLEHDGEADLLGEGLGLVEGLEGRGGAGHDRHVGLHHVRAGAGLFAHGFHRGGRRADEGDAGGVAGAHEGCVLGEEAVAGVDRIGAGFLCGVEDGLLVEVALARRWRPDAEGLVGPAHVEGGAVGFGVDGDGGKAELAAGAHDTQRYLSAVGDEDFLETGHGGRPLFLNDVEVATIMSRVLVTATPELPASRLVELLVDENIGAVPIVDSEGFPVGIVTRYDVIEEDELDITDEVPAVALMHPRPLTVAGSTSVPDAAALMAKQRVHHLLVVDCDGRLIGMLSSFDVVRWVASP